MGKCNKTGLPALFNVNGVEIQIYLSVRNGDIACAAQVEFDNAYAYFRRFVANPMYNDDITAFIEYIKSLCINKGCHSLEFIKNTFGAGWSGIPDSWGIILNKLLSLGFEAYNRWEIYWTKYDLPMRNNLPPVSAVFTYENSRTIYADLLDGDKKVGEAYIWLLSQLSESLNNYGITYIEYFEIYREHREKGYGQAALTAIQQELVSIGFQKLMLWTETDNVAMKRLASRLIIAPCPSPAWHEYAVKIKYYLPPIY